MDSITLAYLLKKEGRELLLLSFDYGQRHKKEIDFARRCAERLGAQHRTVDLSGLNALMRGSALTDRAVEVPEGHYAAPNMAVTVVPNRNAVMLAIAYAAAVSEQAEIVAIGVHGGDHFIYPDCRPAFIEAFDRMQKLAVVGFGQENLRLYAPFLHKTKHDIAALGAELEVPFAETWSCYKGGEKHCGRCGTCIERKEAFALSGVPDPTEYED
jgi:7-cyano-7-deazaguanine synthase